MDLPISLLPAVTATTSSDLFATVNGGETRKVTLQQLLGNLSFTGNTSGTCITDLYVSNIRSCSPLNVNPDDEGNVVFGSTNQIFVDLSNGLVGINTGSPTRKLEVVSNNNTSPFIVSTTASTNNLVIGDDGAIGINTVPSSSNQFRITNNNDLTQGTALRIDANKTDIGTSYGIEVNAQTARANQTLYGVLSTLSATNSGTGTYYAGYFSSSNATNNYGVVVPRNQGDSGFGTITPSATLQIGNPTVGTQGTFRYIDTNVNNAINGSGSTTNYVLKTDNSGNASWGQVSSDSTVGATGTFTTTDGKTVTVTNGLITSIV